MDLRRPSPYPRLPTWRPSGRHGTRAAIAFLAAIASVATASAHNLVRIRGEVFADDHGLVIKTVWTERDIECFRTPTPARPEPSAGDLDQALAIGAALAEDLRYAHPPKDEDAFKQAQPQEFSQVEFVGISLLASAGGPLGERRWELLHRVRLAPVKQRGTLVFCVGKVLQTHPMSLLLSDRYPERRGIRELGLGHGRLVRMSYDGASSDGAQWRLRFEAFGCGVVVPAMYGECSCEPETASLK